MPGTEKLSVIYFQPSIAVQTTVELAFEADNSMTKAIKRKEQGLDTN